MSKKKDKRLAVLAVMCLVACLAIIVAIGMIIKSTIDKNRAADNAQPTAAVTAQAEDGTKDTEKESGNHAGDESVNGPAESGKDTEPTEAPTPTPTPEPTPEPEPELTVPEKYAAAKQYILDNTAKYDALSNFGTNWWFKRNKDHVPSGSGEIFDISAYNGFYRNLNVDENDKVVYLTFDCGYPTTRTEKILDALKAHNAHATFFVTGMFLDGTPEYAVRMREEGHTVGTHSVTHPDLTSKDSYEAIVDEILGCAQTFYDVTGTEMDCFFRFPQGMYSEKTIAIANDLGFASIFWSLAYVDYDQNNQPDKSYVIEHYRDYHHNGMIALSHNDAQCNVEAIDEFLTLLENEGYRFGDLHELLDGGMLEPAFMADGE